MNVSNYVRVTRGLSDPGILIKPEDVSKHISQDHDYYSSLYYYDLEQFNTFQKTKSVKGVNDVLTDRLVFDLDCASDLEQARQDAILVINRLQKYGVQPENLEIYFSGKKGFTIETVLDSMLNPEKLANLAINIIGKDIKTLDKTIYNASRIIRVPNTKHQDTGLFKVQLQFNQLSAFSLDSIKDIATKPGPIKPAFQVLQVPDEAMEETKPKKTKKVVEEEIDWASKPKQWKNCKWSLAQGNFKSGERHQALMILASTCRGLGFTKDMTYDICKGALRRSIDKYGQGTTNKDELYKNIIEDSVFTDSWEGGQYTCQKTGWLQTHCNTLGAHQCDQHDPLEKPCVQFDDMASHFTNYASNFEKNVIKMGIPGLDENIMLCTSTLNGLLGQPGAGKTTLAINYLRNTSLNNIPSVFLSLDMGMPIVFAKLISKQTGMSFKQVMEVFKSDRKRAEQLVADIKHEYKNVGFNFKSGLTVPDIKDIIKEHEKEIGQKVKLVVVDYLECIAGPYAEPTAATGFIANQLKDLANEMEVCVLLLLQTQKHSTPDISDPLLSLKGVKGSSLIEQACSTILTLWREGYSPRNIQDDKYISFAVVKNRFGSLWSDDFSWTGASGNVRGLSPEERVELHKFRNKKLEQKLQNVSPGGSNSPWE